MEKQKLTKALHEGYRIAALFARPDLDFRSGQAYAYFEQDPLTGDKRGVISQQTADQIAKQVGYTQAELQSLPAGANRGMSCGHPLGFAQLHHGEVVLDLGCGCGIDCFLASGLVGHAGRVVGIDLTQEMIERAKTLQAIFVENGGANNIAFVMGDAENVPLDTGAADVVIANGCITLSCDKQRVFREIMRVLRRGGRLAIADIACLRELPNHARESAADLLGCTAGISHVNTYTQLLREVGFINIQITPLPGYVQGLKNVKAGLYDQVAASLPHGETLADYVSAIGISALKADEQKKFPTPCSETPL